MLELWGTKLNNPNVFRSKGIGLIARERSRQIDKEKFEDSWDDEFSEGQLKDAAIGYAWGPDDHLRGVVGCKVNGRFTPLFPDDAITDKRSKHNEIRRLSIAGALIAAELDRILRDDD